MSRALCLYAALLCITVVAWLWDSGPAIGGLARSDRAWGLMGIVAVYLGSHLFRMLRLALLTLDERDKIFPLMAAHGLTAFPSSFLPFKLGEILRLAAFFRVYDRHRKAFAVWLVERFGDVLVIACFILGLYLFKVDIPDSMRIIFVLFVMVSVIGLVGLFAFAKALVYLNRHLVLSSHSRRGLVLLRFSHALQTLEADIRRSVESRVSGFILLSVLVWSTEIAALSLFVHRFSSGNPDFSALFVSGLLASVAGDAAGGTAAFGFYQSLCLATVALVALITVLLSTVLRSAGGK
ncbi:lysylphosphatidylglycerol synthase domain-containing protein [Cupriavidus gilardii]|uniref:lysylphosphatidylglycerol synthase domain-containing protein n=1 Tax=Cupriavidus gilardii TaxID=82541 RepID=UPI002368A488|nr:lysylphosphatidylglycerol synthase domain-containing protein [Cupriavidus gilardii]